MENDKLPLIIIGTDFYARVAMDIAHQLDILVYGLLTDDPEQTNQEMNDMLVVADLESKDGQTLLNDENLKLFVASEQREKRREWVAYADKFPPAQVNLIHPLRSISTYTKTGRGNLVQAGVVIHPNVMLGSFNLIDPQVVIEADCAIGDYCRIRSGARLGMGVQVHDDVSIGMGAIIHDGVHIGKGAVIAPGSVVLKDVDEESSVFGNPAREIDLD